MKALLNQVESWVHIWGHSGLAVSCWLTDGGPGFDTWVGRVRPLRRQAVNG